MSYGFPNWMFAAIAIAAYELGTWIGRQFHLAVASRISYGVVAVCIIIILTRMLLAKLRSFRHQEEDDDDWRNL